MKHTRQKLSIISLLAVLIIALSAFFGLQYMTAKAAGSVDVTNQYSGVLKTSTDNVKIVGAKRIVKSSLGNDGTETYCYATFRFVNKADEKDKPTYAYYNNKLAYRWFESVTVGSGDSATKEVRESWFSMEFGFNDLNFEKFVITFESQQYIKTKDGKTFNYVMFFPVDNDKVYVHVTTNKDDKVEDIPGSNKVMVLKDHIRMEFTGKTSGEYEVKVSNQNNTSIISSVSSAAIYETKFKNIGGDFAKNVESGTTVYPLMFKAHFKEGAEESESSAVSLYSVNGQEFAATDVGTLDADTGYCDLKSIKDTCPPVLCLEKELTFLTQGSKINFNYQIIDVLRQSTSGKVNYYVLSKDNKKAGDAVDADGKRGIDYLNSDLFKELGDNDVLETDYDAYLPMAADLQGTKLTPAYGFDGSPTEDGSLCADMLLKAFVRISDTSGGYQESQDIYVDWYMSDDYKVVVNGTPFVAVAKDTLGAKFNTEGKSDERGYKSWEQLVADYQAKVDEAAKDLKAGSSNYFYLPSPEDLFSDNATAYRDMKISVYYYGKEENSNTNLETSNLSINVTTRGAYTFTVYAHDAADNKMYYFDNKGNRAEFAASEIWTMFKDEGEKNRLPWFTFNVKYSGAEFEEDPGAQATGFVGVSYSSASFKINGVDYNTTYRLFFFNRDSYLKDTGTSFTYDEFMEKKDELFNSAETRKYFTEIIPKAKMEETDAEYKQFADYGWSETSTTFTPQEAGFYLMIAEVKDGSYVSDPLTKSLAVVVSESAKSLKGENDWLQKNLTSVILLSIAGLALVGIILLLVIKPKEKEDIDTRFEEKVNKSSKKSK